MNLNDDLILLKNNAKSYLRAMGMWVYLSSLYQKNATINKQFVMESLNLSIEMTKKIFSELSRLGIIQNKMISKQGRFIGGKTILIKRLTTH